MRTFLTSFAAVVLALSFLSSCGTAAKDIDVTKLEEACDFADAFTSVAAAQAELITKVGEEKPTPEQEKEMEVLVKKGKEIAKAMGIKEVKMEDVIACDGYK